VAVPEASVAFNTQVNPLSSKTTLSRQQYHPSPPRPPLLPSPCSVPGGYQDDNICCLPTDKSDGCTIRREEYMGMGLSGRHGARLSRGNRRNRRRSENTISRCICVCKCVVLKRRTISIFLTPPALPCESGKYRINTWKIVFFMFLNDSVRNACGVTSTCVHVKPFLLMCCSGFVRGGKMYFPKNNTSYITSINMNPMQINPFEILHVDR